MALTKVKRCPKCKDEKIVSLFYNDKYTKDGLGCWCKACVQKKNRNWQLTNSHKCQQYSESYRQRSPEKIKDYYRKNRTALLEAQKIYQLKNREQCSEKTKRWRKNNPEKARAINRKKYATLKGRLNSILSQAIYRSLHGNKKNKRWEKLVGYTIAQLINRLKKTLPTNITWDDYLNGGFHIDHKIPISAFNFKSHTDIDFKKCWALSNLQLLPALENLSKNDKIDGHFQPSFSFSQETTLL